MSKRKHSAVHRRLRKAKRANAQLSDTFGRLVEKRYSAEEIALRNQRENDRLREARGNIMHRIWQWLFGREAA